MDYDTIRDKISELDPESPERKVLAIALRRVEQRTLLRYKPYPWQEDFHNAGKDNAQRLLMAANGVGKTLCGAAETAMHLSGQYPEWWKGRRFKKHVLAWVGSISNQTQRDYTQPALLGSNLGEGLGTGFIPGDCIVGKPRPRQAGIGDVVDMVHVKHTSGKSSLLVFKCHPAGQRVAMADGTWKPIEDVQVGEWGVTAAGVPRRFVQKYMYENSPVLRIKTNCGDIACTPNHPLFTKNKGKINADRISVGDVLELMSQSEGDDREARPVWEVALTGLLIGDGMLRGKTPILTSACDKVLAAVEEILPSDLILKKIGNARYDYKLSSTVANSNRLTSSLRASGLWGRKSDTKRVPEWVYRLPRHQRIIFLRWIWSADGSVERNSATYCTCQVGLAEDVRLLLLSVGIPSKVAKSGDRHFRVYISRDARVSFEEIGKISYAVEPGVPRDTTPWGTVISIEEEGPQDVFALGVAEDDHELVVQGFRVGNTFEQGWRMWQGAAPDVVWIDEQPDESAKDEKRIFAEIITRIFRSSGMMYATLTPLLGETDMIRHFMSSGIKGVWWCGATWDDAPHLNQEEKERAAASYGSHEVDARTKGIPMMGEGRVFTTGEGDIKCPPKPTPNHWARIVGVDFGVDHPAAVAEIAWDRDADVIYVTRVWRQKGADVPTHVMAIRGQEPWIPVAWPHDGLKREPGVDKGLKTLKQIYTEAGATKMLSISARYKSDVGGGQPVEPIVLEMDNRFRNGGLKIFDTCSEFFDEYRSYHRKDGKIVALRDDVIKAVMYAIMMRRYARPKTTGTKRPQSVYTSAVV